MTPQELATKYLKEFELKTRNTGDTFYTLKDTGGFCDTPCCELVRAAHGNRMPNDYVYRYVFEALQLISESDDSTYHDLTNEPDCYTHDLINWMGDHLDHLEYCDLAIQEYQQNNMFDIMFVGQQLHKDEILHFVKHELEKITDSEEG